MAQGSYRAGWHKLLSKIDNPPNPSLAKGGEGGFESDILGNANLEFRLEFFDFVDCFIVYKERIPFCL